VEVFVAGLSVQQPEPLSDEAVDHDRPQDASDGPEHVAGCAAAVKHEGPRRGQCPAQPAQRPVAIDWGRYGELFDYRADDGELVLTPPDDIAA
jgi:hypothetical protein